MVVETIEVSDVFGIEDGIEILVSENVVEDNLGGLIEGLGGDERREIFFSAERVEVIVKVGRRSGGSGLKLGLDLRVKLGGGLGLGEKKGGEDRKRNNNDGETFIEMVDRGFI